MTEPSPPIARDDAPFYCAVCGQLLLPWDDDLNWVTGLGRLCRACHLARLYDDLERA